MKFQVSRETGTSIHQNGPGYPSWRQVETTVYEDWRVRTVVPGPMIHSSRDVNGRLQLTDHQWNYEISEVRGWKGSGRSWNPDFTETIWTEHSGALQGAVPPLPPLELQDLYNRALSKLNERARGSLDLSISLFEGGQTAKMISSVAKVLNHARHWRNWVKAKRRSPKNLREWVRDGSAGAANGWLQWQYGWSPLLDDVFKVLDERQRLVFSQVEKIKGRAGFNRSVNGTKVSIEPISSNNDVTDCECDGINKQSVTICVYLSTKDGLDPSRWTSLNPVSIAWELTPYSFVADWFFDVGSYLRNLETGLLYNSRFKGGYVSQLAVRKVNFDAVSKASRDPREINGRVNCLLRNAEAWRYHTTFRRDLLSSYPMPHRPSFRADLGARRLLSAASLLRQVLK